MTCHRFVFLLALAFFAALPSTGHALTVRCVGNVSQLAAALDEANASSDTAFVIRVRTGTYNAAQVAAPFEILVNVPDQVIELSGGWSGSGGTCQSRSLDPSLTVLVGTVDRTALALRMYSGANSASVAHAHSLTLRNPNNYNANPGNAACLYGSNFSLGEIRVERLHLEQCVSLGSGMPAAYFFNHGVTNGQDTRLTVRNVSLRDSSAKNVGGIAVATYNGCVSRLSQLSITTSQMTDPAANSSGLHLANFGGSVYLSNSVVWGNDPDPATRDIYVHGGSGVYFNRVHYGSLDGTPSGNNAPGTGDPGFVAPGNARLRADSILIDSGIVNPPGGTGTHDADGNARVQGGHVDVGAFEAAPYSDLIFADDFED